MLVADMGIFYVCLDVREFCVCWYEVEGSEKLLRLHLTGLPIVCISICVRLPLFFAGSLIFWPRRIHEPVIQYASVHADQLRTPQAPIMHIAVETALEADETGVIEVVRPLSGPCDSNLDVIDCEVSLRVGIFRRPDLCCCLHLKVTHLHLRVRVH